MRRFALPLALLLSTAAPAFSATFHNVTAKAQCGADNVDLNVETLSTSPVLLGAVSAGPNCGATATAQSSQGTTRVSAVIGNPGDDNDLTLTAGAAQASASISYSFFLATLITDPALVPFSVNLHALGSIQASSNALISDTGQFLNSGQVISTTLRASGSLSGNNQVKTFEERISARVSPGNGETKTLSGDFTTPTIMVRAGDLISLTFGLSGSTSGQLFGAAATGNVNAINSLSFATVGDVFNLPDGYSVVIDEARIVNNRYTPPPPLQMSAVPLPASFWGLFVGIAGLGVMRRRKARQAAVAG